MVVITSFGSHFSSSLPHSQALYFHQAARTAAENQVISRGWRLSEGRSGAGAIVLACMLAVPSAYALSWALLMMTSRCSVLIVQVRTTRNSNTGRPIGIYFVYCIYMYTCGSRRVRGDWGSANTSVFSIFLFAKGIPFRDQLGCS